MRAGQDWVTFRRVHGDGRELLVEMEKFTGNSWKDWLNWRVALLEFMQCMGYDETNEEHMQWLSEDLMSLLLNDDLDMLMQFVNRSPEVDLTTNLKANNQSVPWAANLKQALAELTRVYCPKGTRALILKELGHLRKTSCTSVQEIGRQFRVLLCMIEFLEHDDNTSVPIKIQLQLFTNTMPLKWQHQVLNQPPHRRRREINTLAKLEAQFMICERKVSQLCRVVGFRDTKSSDPGRHGSEKKIWHRGFAATTTKRTTQCRCTTGHGEAPRCLVFGGDFLDRFNNDTMPTECCLGQEAFDEIDASDATACASIARIHSFRERRPTSAENVAQRAQESKKKSWLGIERLSAWLRKRRRSFKSMHVDSSSRPTQRARTRHTRDDFHAHCDPMDPTVASATASPTCCSYLGAPEEDQSPPSPPLQEPPNVKPTTPRKSPPSDANKPQPKPQSKPKKQLVSSSNATATTAVTAKEACVEIEVVRSFHFDSSLAVSHERSPPAAIPARIVAKDKQTRKLPPQRPQPSPSPPQALSQQIPIQKRMEIQDESDLTSFHIDSQRFSKTCLVSLTQPKPKRKFQRYNSLPRSIRRPEYAQLTQHQQVFDEEPSGGFELEAELALEIQASGMPSPIASSSGSFSGFEEEVQDLDPSQDPCESMSMSPFFVSTCLNRKGSCFAMLSDKEQVMELETCTVQVPSRVNGVHMDANHQNPMETPMTSFHF